MSTSVKRLSDKDQDQASIKRSSDVREEERRRGVEEFNQRSDQNEALIAL